MRIEDGDARWLEAATTSPIDHLDPHQLEGEDLLLFNLSCQQGYSFKKKIEPK
jgi:hypothetical protein